MTVQRQDTEVYSLRFSAQGKDFAVEVRLSIDRSEAQTALYDEGRLIFTQVEPVELAGDTGQVEATLRGRAETLRAEIIEMYGFTEEMSESVDPNLWGTLAEMFEARGIFDEAVQLYGNACKFDPENTHLQYQLGNCLSSLGKYGEACEPLARAVTSKPLYADFRNAYGYALIWSGQVREGFKQMEQALELNTYYTDALMCYGISLLFNGIKGLDRELAHDFIPRSLGMFEKAVMADESIRSAEYDRGLRQLKAGKVREALEAFRTARDVARREKALSYDNIRATFIGKLRSTDRQAVIGQIRALVDQLADNPDYVDLEYELGVAHLKLALCDWRAGLENFKVAIERSPQMKKAVVAHDVAYSLYQELEKQVSSMTSSFPEAESK